MDHCSKSFSRTRRGREAANNRCAIAATTRPVSLLATLASSHFFL
jgi:hypothetical protein